MYRTALYVMGVFAVLAAAGCEESTVPTPTVPVESAAKYVRKMEAPPLPPPPPMPARRK